MESVLRAERRGERAHRRAHVSRLAVLLVVTAACAVVMGAAGAKPASACGAYWTVGCQFYSPNESHTTGNQFSDCCEIVYTTFDPTNGSISAIRTRSGGGWIQTQATLYGLPVQFSGVAGSDRFGCWNPNGIQYYVNCRSANTY